MSDTVCKAAAALTDAQAKMEASRCLMCDDPPCVAACPAEVPVKHFIRAIRFDSPRRAINLIRERNVFAGVCGVACPVDELCVGACTSTELNTPIAIGQLQHYAAVKALEADWRMKTPPVKGARVAVIGAGPSGLAAAAELAKLGHRPTVFEKEKLPGGICTYGVPGHRVPQELVAGEIAHIQSLGVEIETGAALGPGRKLDDLLAGEFRAAYISMGLAEAVTPGIRGEKLAGVTTWRALLGAFSAYNLGEGDRPIVAKSVIVVGGGSVAMDVASAAHELGAEEIDMVCLESPREMPAYHAELSEVCALGVRFHTRSMPLEITGENGKVTGLRLARIRWKEPDRFVPANAERIKETEYWLPGEMVVFAIGARPVAGLREALPGVTFDKSGRIAANPKTGATSREGVFAGGDAVAGGGTTIVKAVAEGKRAGQAIAAYLGRVES
ncbi:MAG: FAD-dependent oxidoreductase [Planctomycetota bacterium]